MPSRISELILKITDQFSAKQQAYVTGMEKAEVVTGKFTNATGQSAEGENKLAAASSKVGDAHNAHTNKLTTLHHSLEISRREEHLLINSLLQMVGVGGEVTQVVGALASGIGPMAVAMTAAGAAFAFFHGQIEAQNKRFEEGAKAIRAYVEEQSKLGRTIVTDAGHLGEMAEAQKQYDAQVDKAAKNVAMLEGQLKAAIKAGLEEDQVTMLQTEYNTALDRLTRLIDARNNAEKQREEGLGMSEAMKKSTEEETAALRKQAEMLDKLRTANAPVREEEETQETFEAAQFNNRMARSHDLRSLIAADTTRIMDLDRQAATNRTNAYAQAAADATRSLESIISGELQLSKVTAADIAAAQAGKATPTHADENIRRVRIFQTIDTNIDTDPEAQRILTLMPQKIRQKLEDAFHAGGTKALHLTAMDLVGGMESFADLSGWDVNVIADNVQKKIEEMKNKKQLTAAVQQVLVGRGFDPNDPETQKALGIETGAERALKVNASISFEKGKLAAEVDKAKKDLDALFATYSPAPALSEGVDKNSAAVQGSGVKAAQNWLSGFGEGLTDGAGNVYSRFFKDLVGSLDDRYVRADTSARGPR